MSLLFCYNENEVALMLIGFGVTSSCSEPAEVWRPLEGDFEAPGTACAPDHFSSTLQEQFEWRCVIASHSRDDLIGQQLTKWDDVKFL